MLGDIPHSETPPIEGNLLPESNGHSHHAPDLGAESGERDPKELEYLRILTEIGNAASKTVEPKQEIDLQTILEGGFDLREKETAHKIEIFGDTEESARKVADAIVQTANAIHDGLIQRDRRLPLNTEPASPLLISGKLLAEIVRLQASGGTDRDTYEHSDEAVSMLGYAWRLYFGHSEDETLDAIRFLAYIHDLKRTVPEEVHAGRHNADAFIHMSPQVIRNVLQKLAIDEARAAEIMHVYDLLSEVPNPKDESKEYIPSIQDGIEKGGIMFILTKFACLQDMMYLERNSPLKEVSQAYGEGKFDQRLIAKWHLSTAAADYGKAASEYGLIPGTIETVNRDDLLTARRFKSHFPLDEVAKSVIENLVSKK
jgi:hypothetical protein